MTCCSELNPSMDSIDSFFTWVIKVCNSDGSLSFPNFDYHIFQLCSFSQNIMLYFLFHKYYAASSSSSSSSFFTIPHSIPLNTIISFNNKKTLET